SGVEECLGALMLPGSRKACDLPFDERQFDTADACRLTRTIDTGHRSLLVIVDQHAIYLSLTSEQQGQLDIWDQVVAAGKVIAVDSPGSLSTTQEHVREPVITIGRDRPAAGKVRSTKKTRAQ